MQKLEARKPLELYLCKMMCLSGTIGNCCSCSKPPTEVAMRAVELRAGAVFNICCHCAESFENTWFEDLRRDIASGATCAVDTRGLIRPPDVAMVRGQSAGEQPPRSMRSAQQTPAPAAVRTTPASPVPRLGPRWNKMNTENQVKVLAQLSSTPDLAETSSLHNLQVAAKKTVQRCVDRQRRSFLNTQVLRTELDAEFRKLAAIISEQVAQSHHKSAQQSGAAAPAAAAAPAVARRGPPSARAAPPSSDLCRMPRPLQHASSADGAAARPPTAAATKNGAVQPVAPCRLHCIASCMCTMNACKRPDLPAVYMTVTVR